jgi:hypothetical protein
MAQPKLPHGFLASIAIAAQPLRMSPTTLQVPPVHFLIAAARASVTLRKSKP